ncbi:MAG: NAD(P)/FAD-dependent oxidoreductase [SAR202 cluster bacterium]|nr:hypothetical protein [Chloroflexota bacterium]MQG59003.1 NAD(P)/FAD-dependent oxidoreductase [SAR202 cluster bacterium]MQG70300.1 NAD(P)/FAD-dependent oxidoreductase [SAR202 cluster bacterium]HAL48702.1 hypothetical protein [Dehalococcoidia bacterium]
MPLRDVIVIGAGPAGNIAASELASRGWDVAVIDWRENLGEKLCTGIVGMECHERFPVRPEHIYRHARSATVYSPSGKEYPVLAEKPTALIVDRAAYIRSMADTAMACGAEYILGSRVSRFQSDNSGITVEATSGDTVSKHHARLAVITSGFGTPLLRMAGLRDGKKNDHMVGNQTEVRAEGLADTEVYTGDHVAPESFGWLVPLDGSRALVGIMSRHRLNGHLQHFQEFLTAKGKISEPNPNAKSWGIPLKPVSKTYADRVLVAGDAAGFAKPTTGGGIYYALISGQMAGRTAAGALENDQLTASELKSYESDWKQVIGKELRVGYYARMLFESMDDAQLERLMGLFLSEGVLRELILSPEFSFDWHSGTIMKTVRHGDLGPLIRSFGPLVAPFLGRLLRQSVTR